MCGRFTLYVDLDDILALMPGLVVDQAPAPRYNIAPAQMVATVPNVLDADGARRLAYMRWGLVPAWSKDHTIGSRLINARGETVHEKPSFRGSFKYKRCLIWADGFYEWAAVPGAKSKQPVYIRMKSGEPFAFAGLWDTWHDRAGTGDSLTTCTIITTTPNAVVGPLHNRMPVILPPAAYDDWLQPGEYNSDRLRALLAPYPADKMEAYPVARAVNRPGADDPSLIAPLADPPTLL
ncbi:MAG: SOS response-associated peptidase [Anaerolineae bacterium]|nr:SOS response-associated peptidase [Anaerolineae bacterium]